MFGCLLEIDCYVSTYCVHGDVFQWSIIYKTRYQTLPGLSLFALTAAPLLNSWQNKLLHCSFQSPFDILNDHCCPDFPPVIVPSKNLWPLMSLSRRKGKGKWGNPDYILVWMLKASNFLRFREGLPKYQCNRRCVYALQRGGNILALWSYQKEKREWKEDPLTF